MITSEPNYIASKVLEKLAAWYDQDNLEEFIINTPGECWTKFRRGEWQRHDAPDLTYEYLSRVCKVLANVTHARFSETELPVVSCAIPGKPFRFQAIMGGNVRYRPDDTRGVAIAIRALKADTSIDFASYGLTGSVSLPGARAVGEQYGMSSDHVDMLRDIIERKMTLIISGATSTGKTTFTNKIIELIPRDQRLITVEDTPELTVPHENRVQLLASRNKGTNSVTYTTIIDSLVRLTPEWIICGELSVDNAQPIYATMGKGHPIITTVHAATPDEAISAFTNNMAISSGESSLSGDAMERNIRSQVGAIVQLERRNGQRSVVDIVFPFSEGRDEGGRAEGNGVV